MVLRCVCVVVLEFCCVSGLLHGSAVLLVCSVCDCLALWLCSCAVVVLLLCSLCCFVVLQVCCVVVLCCRCVGVLCCCFAAALRYRFAAALLLVCCLFFCVVGAWCWCRFVVALSYVLLRVGVLLRC